MNKTKRFLLVRSEDVSKISGEGVVAHGVEFSDGTAVMKWCVKGKPNSVSIYNSVADLLEIHGHEGRTVVSWLDGNAFTTSNTLLQFLREVA